MGLNIKVLSNAGKVARTLRSAPRKEMPRILTQAINRTAANVRTETTRNVAKETGLKSRDVRSAITIRRRATFRNLKAVLVAAGRALNLARFGAKQVRRGISARAWGKRRIYKGTFFGHGGRTVFKRTSAERLPIAPVFGPSVPRTYVQEETQKVVGKTVRTRWPINFRQAFRRRFPKEPQGPRRPT